MFEPIPFDFDKKLPYRQGASVMLFDANNKFLMVKKPRPVRAWALPQGGVDAGETTLEAVLRETLEEVGIRLESATDSGVIYTYDWQLLIEGRDDRAKYRGQQIRFFVAKFPENQVIKYNDDPYEPKEGKFVDLAEAKALIEPEYQSYYEILAQVFAFAQK